MPISRKGLIVTAIVVFLVGALVMRLYRAASIRSHPPKGLPNAIWVPAPLAPLDFTPRGVWLGCWLDQHRNINHCQVTDYEGKLEFDEDFSAVSGSVPIPDERLQFKQVGTMELWTWPEKDQRGVPVIRLKDGAILVPSRDLTELRARYAP